MRFWLCYQFHFQKFRFQNRQILVSFTNRNIQNISNQKFFLISATDINSVAIETTLASGRANGVTNVHVVMTNLVDDLKLNVRHQVDLLVTNPPFEPSPMEDVGKCGAICAWSAGPNGRAIIDRILFELPELMSERGVALMCCIKENDIDDIRRQMMGKDFYSTILIEGDGTTSSNYNRIYHQYVVAFSKTNYWCTDE